MIRRRLDEIFSRRMLGSVLVGMSAGEIVKNTVQGVFKGPSQKVVVWAVLFVLFVCLFVWWEYVQGAVEEAGQKAKEAVDQKE